MQKTSRAHRALTAWPLTGFKCSLRLASHLFGCFFPVASRLHSVDPWKCTSGAIDRPLCLALSPERATPCVVLEIWFASGIEFALDSQTWLGLFSVEPMRVLEGEGKG